MGTITILPMAHVTSNSLGALSNMNRSDSRVRDLNDELRTSFSGGRVLLTSGVQALDEGDRIKLLQAVQTFDDFNAGNDPYGEHDFGRVVVGEQDYFWKIDCYDLDFRFQSPDPADATVTARVMTIMREDEY
ncbi:DUF3768 domain-containing protein [Neorhizobium alkalisoli]|uniref:DUF3768 domain-containing protein n=1 Tax=Neorhizobium alkalisoli TaxID=528178 RepID=UPI001FDF858C|nr:DUF3768 domain-containing protein [Neorhizobium alkalisoli]